MSIFRSREKRRPPFEGLVDRMRRDHETGRFMKAYNARAGYGYNVGEDDMSRETWFWFNAYGALGGIKAGLDPLSGYLAGYCGMATTSLDWDNPQERAAKEEIERLAFPS